MYYDKATRHLTLFSYATACCAMLISSNILLADSITPSLFNNSLIAGESQTIRHTITVESVPSDSFIDVMFLFDTSGSMTAELNAAKAGATDIINGLSAFGSTATGTGYFNDPLSQGIFKDLTLNSQEGIDNINAISMELGNSNGGDFPEEGFHATFQAATQASWRHDSNRFIVALTDATFKESDGTTVQATEAALIDNNIKFIGLDFGGTSNVGSGGIDPRSLAEKSGGRMVSSQEASSEIVDDILKTISDSFQKYSEVSISSNLDTALLGYEVNCISADTGECLDGKALGDFDRNTERTFEFDVTYTAITQGDADFTDYALADAGIIASSNKNLTITDTDSNPVPEPSGLFLLLAGLFGLHGINRKPNKAR